MIKGINRQVVEVRETGSDYFEKILFFVKPEYSSVSEGKIRERAGLIAGKGVRPPVTRKKRDTLIQAGKFIFCAIAGFIVGAVTVGLL